MPLPAGVVLNRDVHPPESWPQENPASLVAARLGQGNGRPARIAPDGTRWCAYGDHTVDPRSRKRQCDHCKGFRERTRKKPVGAAAVSLPTEVAHGLIAASRECDQAVKRAQGKFLLNQDLTTGDLEALITTAMNTNTIAALAAEILRI